MNVELLHSRVTIVMDLELSIPARALIDPYGPLKLGFVEPLRGSWRNGWSPSVASLLYLIS